MRQTINRVLERDSAGKSLNIHFASVGPKLGENFASKESNNPFVYIKSNDSAAFLLKEVTRSQFLMRLKQLKNSKACAPDRIPTNLEKDVANFISHPLTLIYNPSMKNSIFPIIEK